MRDLSHGSKVQQRPASGVPGPLRVLNAVPASVGPQFFAGDLTATLALDVDRALQGNGPDTTRPLPHQLRRAAQCSGNLRLPTMRHIDVLAQLHAAHLKRGALLSSSEAHVAALKRDACNLPMPSIGEVRHANLLQLIASCGTATAFAEKVGTSEQYVSQLVNRTRDSKTGRPREIGGTMARRIDAAFGYDSGWMDLQHPSGGDKAPIEGEVQVLSPSVEFHEIPRMTRDQLMSEVETQLKSALFILDVGTDALLPRWPSNVEIVWSRSRPPRPGKPILVRDMHQRLHVRIYRESRSPGIWEAVSLDPSFASFSSDADGLQIVGVYKGQLDPDD